MSVKCDFSDSLAEGIGSVPPVPALSSAGERQRWCRAGCSGCSARATLPRLLSPPERVAKILHKTQTSEARL